MANPKIRTNDELAAHEAGSFVARRATLQPYVLSCGACKMEFRVENLTPFTMAERRYYCPACGSSSVTNRNDYRNDRWRSLARTHGLPDRESSVELLKNIYDIWDPNEYPWFKDFVAKMVSDVRAGVAEQ